MAKRAWVWIPLGCVLWTAVSRGGETASPSEPCGPAPHQGNVWGVNLGWEPGWSTPGTVRLLSLARTLVGEWGYIRHGVAPTTPDIANHRRSMAMIRAHRLIPIAGGAYPPPETLEPGKPYPRLDADGTMRSAARKKAEVWRALYEAGIPFHSVEVMNELNVNDAWPPDRYAQYLYDYAVEVKKAYPGLKICSCGMAGSGADYYDRIFKHKPELKDVVDFWGCHPYGANHPPEFRPEGTSLRSYEETIAVLKKYGVDDIRLMATETGYELEFSDTGKDINYPPVGELNRAKYMARAFRDYYVHEPQIQCVAVFQLWDLPWHNWNGWDLMYHDGTPRPIYEAMRAEPKSPGRDWLETGPGRITGRITWRDTDIGVPRMIVYTEPGLYGAVTDDRGCYAITDLPEGEYAVHAFSDGYESAGPETVRVTADRPGTFSAGVQRVSLISSFEPVGASMPHGWENPGKGDMVVDGEIAHNGRPSLRVTVKQGESAALQTYGNYNSAYPSEIYVAEVYVRASPDARIEPGGGPWLELALSNGRGEVASEARMYAPTFKRDGRWHRITAAVFGPERSSRVRVRVGVDGAEGAFWFSPPFVGEADFPLPTDAAYKTTGYEPLLYDLNRRLFAQAVVDVRERNPELNWGIIRGRVLDFRGRPLAHAAISSDAPLFCTLSDENGYYYLKVPVDTEVRVRACALGERPAISDPISVKAGSIRAEVVHLQTSPPPAPDHLVNGGFNTFHEKEPGLMTGWTGFGTTDGAYAGGSDMIVGKPMAHEGKGLYFAHSGSNTKNGGAYQVIQAEPGATYHLTGWVYTFTEGELSKPMDNNCRIGIDPTGGRNPDSPDILWSPRTQSELKWTQVETRATAQTERITVFIQHEMRRANIWNLTCFDDLRLEKIEP